MKKESEEHPPRVAISYSHKPDEHAERVLALAQRLASDGVDVEIDKWSVREGHDLNAFMERMVTDPTVTKVLILSNKSYAEKADARQHGVGTEAQILSAELYGRVQQEKFIPVVCEFENGVASLPVFLKGRLYIDFSSAEAEATNYERLLRRIFDKPEHVKPAVGKPPVFITADTMPANPLSGKIRAYREALLSGRANTGLAFDAAMGWNFNKYVAADFETGFIGAKINNVPGYSSDNSRLYNVPFLFNVTLSCPIPRTNIIPYVGAGVGGADVVFDTDNFNDGVTTVTGSENDVVFAGQVFAGLRFQLTHHLSLDLGYKYFATDDPTFSYPPFPNFDVGFRGARTHSVLATLRFDF